ncbi:MAG TPA: lysylphosphatidylglycerol synthase transmembrane domain-containing protein [archaeon]|nr:lysylphosphatidylglycerol synthase transmembrane domain-containing protein [archaeon]
MEFVSKKKMLPFFLISILVFGAFVFLGGYEDVSRSLLSVAPQTIILVLLSVSLSYAIRFYRWEFLLKSVGIKIPRKTSLFVYFSGFSMVITPGKVGDIFKSYLLKSTSGIKIRDSVSVVVFERVADILAMSAFALLGAYLIADSLYVIGGVVLLIGIMIMLLHNEKILARVVGPLARRSKMGEYLKDAYPNFKRLAGLRTLFPVVSISMVSWFFECLAFWIVLQSMGANVDILGAVFVFAFSSIFGSILVLPGGVGAAEGSFYVLLTVLGVTTSVALAAIILIRLLTLWYGVLVGIVSTFIVSKYFIKETEAVQTRREIS